MAGSTIRYTLERPTKGWGERVSLKDLGVGDQLLGDNAGDGKHGKTTVVDLLGLDDLKGSWLGGLEAKRVELKVAVDIAVSKAGNADR